MYRSKSVKNKQKQNNQEKKLKAQIPEHVPIENMIILVGVGLLNCNMRYKGITRMIKVM